MLGTIAVQVDEIFRGDGVVWFSALTAQLESTWVNLNKHPHAPSFWDSGMGSSLMFLKTSMVESNVWPGSRITDAKGGNYRASRKKLNITQILLFFHHLNSPPSSNFALPYLIKTARN